jgi:hypothetical protein
MKTEFKQFKTFKPFKSSERSGAVELSEAIERSVQKLSQRLISLRLRLNVAERLNDCV